KATYFDLSAEAHANLETFNPFRAVAPLSDPARVAFAGEINMARFPGDRLWLECNRIVAITADGAWRPATNCGFPNGNGQAFLPGDHLRTALYFDGFEGLRTSDIVRVDYRRTESIVAIRQTLWQAAQ